MNDYRPVYAAILPRMSLMLVPPTDGAFMKHGQRVYLQVQRNNNIIIIVKLLIIITKTKKNDNKIKK